MPSVLLILAAAAATAGSCTLTQSDCTNELPGGKPWAGYQGRCPPNGGRFRTLQCRFFHRDLSESAADVHKVLTTTSFSPSSCTPGRCGRCLGYFSGAQENTLVSREQCACICHSKGFTMAGVENGNNCYCKPFLFYFPATPPPCLLTA